MKEMKPSVIVFLITTVGAFVEPPLLESINPFLALNNLQIENVNLNAVENPSNKLSPDSPGNHRKFLEIPKLDYVDKSFFIRDALTLFIDYPSSSRIPSILITRPHGFGKTVALSSLYYFCNHSFKNATALFSGLNIMSNNAQTKVVREKYKSKFPVIWIDFGSVKYKTFEENTKEIKRIISDIFRGYQYLLETKKLNSSASNRFKKLIEGSEGSSSVQSAIPFLGECIREYHKKVPIVLIDNYDAPFHTGYEYNYFKRIEEFMFSFYHHTMQENHFVHRVFLTGVTEIHDSSFYILENMHVYTILDDTFSEHFGFTREEVQHMIKWSESEKRFEKIVYECGGYSFGNTYVFNPTCAVMEIFAHKSYKLSKAELKEPGKSIVEKGFYPIFSMVMLLDGKSITMDPERYVNLPDLENRDLTFWSYLVHSGYVAYSPRELRVRIPNNEVRQNIENLIKETDKTFFADYKNFTDQLILGDYEDSKYFFQKYIQGAGKYVWVADDTEFMKKLLGYVQLMLHGVEKRFNTTAVVTRYTWGSGVEVKSDRAGTAPVKVFLAQFETKEAMKHVHREPDSGKTAIQMNLVFDGKDVFIVAEADFLKCHNVRG